MRVRAVDLPRNRCYHSAGLPGTGFRGGARHVQEAPHWIHRGRGNRARALEPYPRHEEGLRRCPDRPVEEVARRVLQKCRAQLPAYSDYRDMLAHEALDSVVVQAAHDAL